MTPDGFLDVYLLARRGPLDLVQPLCAHSEGIGLAPASLTGEQPA